MIGPFCVIERDVQLGQQVRLDSHVVLKRGVILEDQVEVHSGAIVGDDPQIIPAAFDFDSGVSVGARTVIREGVTIHRSSMPNQNTTIGHDCLLMAFSHVGHDCVVGNNCILVNQVLLAGHVVVHDYACLSGHVVIHQWVHIGESAFVSGQAAITQNIPPFVIAWSRDDLSGLNLVGLQRRGFTPEAIADIKQMYRWTYQSLSVKRNAQQALDEHKHTTDFGRQFLEFFINTPGDRGFLHPHKA